MPSIKLKAAHIRVASMRTCLPLATHSPQRKGEATSSSFKQSMFTLRVCCAEIQQSCGRFSCGKNSMIVARHVIILAPAAAAPDSRISLRRKSAAVATALAVAGVVLLL